MLSKRLRLLAGLVAALGLASVVTLWALKRYPFEPAPRVEVIRKQLDLRDGVLHLAGQPAPFDGLLVENWKTGGPRKLEIEIATGRAHGRSRGWFENGQLEVEESFKNGTAHGLRTRWYPNGKKRSETHIETGVATGVFREWHDNGQLATEVTLHEGQPHGEARAWYPSGTLKSKTQLAHGQTLSQEQFPDTSP